MSITREIRDPDRLADPARYDLGRLTAAERLFLWRHRQRATNGRLKGRNGSSMNQAEAAALLGISPKLYNNLENRLSLRLFSEEACPECGWSKWSFLLKRVEGVRPTRGELCFLARRRSGLLLMTLERELGVSRPRYHDLERAGDPAMVAFWEERGFRFPA